MNYEQTLYTEGNKWFVKLNFANALIKEYDFDTEQSARAFFKLISDIIYYIKANR